MANLSDSMFEPVEYSEYSEASKAKVDAAMLADSRTINETWGFPVVEISILLFVLFIFLMIYLIKKYHLVSKVKDIKIEGYKRTPKPDELLKWHDLKEKGVITEEEFEVHKKRILE